MVAIALGDVKSARLNHTSLGTSLVAHFNHYPGDFGRVLIFIWPEESDTSHASDRRI